MSKRLSAKYKINRRLGLNLWGRAKSPVNKREYGPGQLAAEKSKKDKLPDLPENIKPTEKNLQKIRNNELFSIMQILQKAEAYELSEVFALRLYALYQKPEEIVALAHLMTEEAGRPDMAVTIARRARQNGIYLGSLGYPVLDIPEDSPTEQAVLLSIIRQESSFSSHVVSPAGARGLMQIMLDMDSGGPFLSACLYMREACNLSWLRYLQPEQACGIH